MHFNLLKLSDKNIIDAYFKACKIVVSDLSFTNLFLWHFSRKIEWCECEDCLIIRTTYPDESPFIFYPLHKNSDKNAKKRALEALIADFKAQNLPFSIHSLSTSDKDELDLLMPELFSYEFREDRSDYIYDCQELINLAGKKYHKKKTHYNNFCKAYDFSYEALSQANASELASVYSKWFEAQPNKTEGLKNEFIGITAALENFSELDFKGGILRVDGVIAAFSFGEMLNDECAVIHIEKGDINYNGVYQAINREFLAHEFSSAKIVNREEDLGIEGLRKAKQSYQPIYLEQKFNASLKV